MLLLRQRNKLTLSFYVFFLLKRTDPFLNCFCLTDIFTAEKLDSEHAEFKVMGLVQGFYFCQVKCDAKINLLWMVKVPPSLFISSLLPHKDVFLRLLPLPGDNRQCAPPAAEPRMEMEETSSSKMKRSQQLLLILSLCRSTGDVAFLKTTCEGQSLICRSFLWILATMRPNPTASGTE